MLQAFLELITDLKVLFQSSLFHQFLTAFLLFLWSYTQLSGFDLRFISWWDHEQGDSVSNSMY